MKCLSRRSGFTLIELLVVIAIIAVLAAILFPLFEAARENARTAKCLSNIKQINTAALQYADDNNGKYVGLNCYDTNPRDDKFQWDQEADWRNSAICKYVKSSKAVLLCPSDTRKARLRGVPRGYSFSYTLNSWVTWRTGHEPDLPYSNYPPNPAGSNGNNYTVRMWRARFDGFPVSWFKRPSKTITFVDEHADPRSGGVWINDALFIGDDLLAARHNDYGTVAYLDGHVSKLRSGKNGTPFLANFHAVDSNGKYVFVGKPAGKSESFYDQY